jgi:5-methylthioadenosine/S-adenosylhomocysteine deaminase
LTQLPRRYTARWVLPVTNAPIRDGSVLLDENGRIAAVGPASAVPASENIPQIDLGEAILMPGVVNAHVHLDLSFLRGRLEDRTFPDWIAELLLLKRQAALTAEEALTTARWSCVEAIAAGITTIATTEDGAAGFDAMIDSGMRGIAYHEVFGPDPAQAVSAMAAARDTIALLRERETGHVRVGVSPHAPYSVSDALYRAVAAFARHERLPIAAHIAESHDEQDLVTRGEGTFAARLQARGISTPARARSPVAVLEATGVLELAPLLIHCTRADAADVALLAAAGASVAHCPVANARLGHGIAPITAFQENGVGVAIGTDSVASNNRLDLFEEARFAQMLQRAFLGDATLLTAERLLRMITIDGARALGLDARIGSLETGKDADLCCVSLRAPHARPVHDPLAALFHSARASDVCLTVVAGRTLYTDGVWHTVDVEETRRGVDELAARVTVPTHAK